MTLEARAREWLDTHVSDTEGRDDIVRSLTELLREVRTAGMLEAAEIAEEVREMNLPTASYSWNGACKWIAQQCRTAAGSKP